MGRVVHVELSQEVELSRGSSCLVGRVVSCFEFFVGRVFLGRVVTRVVLSRGSSCHMGRDDLTPVHETRPCPN